MTAANCVRTSLLRPSRIRDVGIGHLAVAPSGIFRTTGLENPTRSTTVSFSMAALYPTPTKRNDTVKPSVTPVIIFAKSALVVPHIARCSLTRASSTFNVTSDPEFDGFVVKERYRGTFSARSPFGPLICIVRGDVLDSTGSSIETSLGTETGVDPIYDCSMRVVCRHLVHVLDRANIATDELKESASMVDVRKNVLVFARFPCELHDDCGRFQFC